MDDEDLNLEEAMDAVFRAFSYDRLVEGEFTVRMYADRNGLPYSTANRHLREAARVGLVSARRAIYDGRACWAYRWKGEVPDGARKGKAAQDLRSGEALSGR